MTNKVNLHKTYPSIQAHTIQTFTNQSLTVQTHLPKPLHNSVAGHFMNSMLMLYIQFCHKSTPNSYMYIMIRLRSK